MSEEAQSGQSGQGSEAGAEPEAAAAAAAQSKPSAKCTNPWQASYNNKETWIKAGCTAAEVADLPEWLSPEGDHAQVPNGGKHRVHCKCCSKSFKCTKVSIVEHLLSASHKGNLDIYTQVHGIGFGG